MDINYLTREDALKLHRQMWSDMKSDLGDCPAGWERSDYKSEWCDAKFPANIISYNCFLCEYGEQQSIKEFGGLGNRCQFCPIDWSVLLADSESVLKSTCFRRYMGRANTYIYEDAPISEILALPERK